MSILPIKKKKNYENRGGKNEVFLNLFFWCVLLFCQSSNAACVVSGDAIYKIVSFYQDFEAEISAASAGNLICSNSTIVNPKKENKPTEIIDYNLSINLDGNDEQPASVALVALVSDDGCDAFLDEKQWILECKKGQDISTGARRYHELLLPGAENNFKIKYSQTFYDPEILDEDLDGLSLIVFPIEIDISVKDPSGKMNDRILVKKGEIIEIAINPIFWQYDLPSNEKIKWQLGRIDKNGNIEWEDISSTGAKISLKMKKSGIFQIRLKINEQIFYYKRHFDAPNPENIQGLYKNDKDLIGVYTFETQKKLIDRAYFYCENLSTKFSKKSNLDLAEYGITGYRGWVFNQALKGVWKCNIFVYAVAYDVGIKLKLIKRTFYDSPPLVKEWNNHQFEIVAYPYPNWNFLNVNFPEPGFIINDSEHMGILDYDGTWISAGEFYVNKKACLGDYAGEKYMTASTRNREDN